MNQQLLENRKATADRLGIPESAMPRHIAIIMDGNGRWATQQGLPRYEGHREGGKRVEPIVIGAIDLGIEAISLYSFSLQNWKRPAMEVDFLMQLFTRYLVEIRGLLMEKNVKLQHLGRKDGLPDSLREELEKTIELTSKNDGMILGLALNYGGREEIVDAVKAVAQKYKDGSVELGEIDEECVNENLTTFGMPEADMVIRTSKELRISNFLLWQTSYAEFFPTDVLWPDFTVEHMESLIGDFGKRSRRLGDVKPQEQ